MKTTYFRDSSFRPLTPEYIQQVAPSIYTDRAIDTVSDAYSVIKTHEVIDALAKEGFLPVAVKQQRAHRPDTIPFTRHLVVFRSSQYVDRQPAINELVPEVLLRNSHDGKSAYQLCLGLFRQVCTNGMVVADSTLGKISVAHKGTGLMDRIIEGTYEIVSHSDRAISEMLEWQAVKLNEEAIETYTKDAFLLRYDEEDLSTFNWPDLNRVRRFEDQGNDLYRVYNRVQEGLTKGGLHGRKLREGKKPRLVSTRGIKSIDTNLKLNRELWLLTQETANKFH